MSYNISKKHGNNLFSPEYSGKQFLPHMEVKFFFLIPVTAIERYGISILNINRCDYLKFLYCEIVYHIEYIHIYPLRCGDALYSKQKLTKLTLGLSLVVVYVGIA